MKVSIYKIIMNKKLFNDLWEVFLDIEREKDTYKTNKKGIKHNGKN